MQNKKNFYPNRKLLRRITNPRLLFFLKKSLFPISNKFGMERGTPVDRWYIEKFLNSHINFIKDKKCLEVRDSRYATQFGASNVDIIDIDKSNKLANINSDLRKTELQNDTYDCIILTQVLQFIDNFHEAIQECHRILKPGGVVLATLPSLSRIDVHAGINGDFWRFTIAGSRYVFYKFFNSVDVASYGNIQTGVGFWIGQAAEEFSKKELDFNDINFPVIIGVVAKKSI